MSSTISIIVPAYNEEKAIGKVIDGILKQNYDFVKEIIVIDDGSTDNTAKIARDAGAKVIQHKGNMGYGASLKTGVRNSSSDYVLFIDADGQHRPEYIQDLYREMEVYDMVVGHRTGIIHSNFWRMPGKWLLSIMANYIARRKIPDLNSGLRVIRKEVLLKYMHLCPMGFSFTTTITMAFLSRGYKVGYIPINIEKRQGKSTVTIRTGINTIILILRIAALFDPLRVFLPISFILSLIGIVWGLPIAVLGRGISVGALLAFLTSLILFSSGLISDQISQLRLEKYE